MRGSRYTPRAALAIVGVGAALGATACLESIGEGNGPKSLAIGLGTETLFECYAARAVAALTFEGSSGSNAGDYTDQAQWSSDNPGVAEVSNGDLLASAGHLWPKGWVVARAPGIATLRATYLSFEARTTVTVLPMQPAISPTLTDIAENLPQSFELEMFQGGLSYEEEVPISTNYVRTNVNWRFAHASSAAYVEGGLVQANSATTDVLELVAELPECGRSAQTAFRVSPIASLALVYEQPELDTFPVGTSEAFAVEAVFATPGSTRQNLSWLVDVDNAHDEEIAVEQGSEKIVVAGLAEISEAVLSLSLPDGVWAALTRPLRFVETELESVAVTPDALQVSYPSEGQFDAIGYYANGQSLRITRHVDWSAEDGEGLAISNESQDAGHVYVGNLDLEVEVTATAAAATEDSIDTVELSIKRAK